jgi:hydrogenase maturation protease
VRRCVIGVGNAFRGDDAVGLEVVRLLKGTVPPDVALHECEGEPVAMLELWADCDTAVIVDAMSSGTEPGVIRRIDARNEELPPELHRPSTHLLGVGQAIELARRLDRLPGSVVLFAIEGRQFAAGDTLSTPVAAAAAVVVNHVRRELL